MGKTVLSDRYRHMLVGVVSNKKRVLEAELRNPADSCDGRSLEVLQGSPEVEASGWSKKKTLEARLRYLA